MPHTGVKQFFHVCIGARRVFLLNVGLKAYWAPGQVLGLGLKKRNVFEKNRSIQKVGGALMSA